MNNYFARWKSKLCTLLAAVGAVITASAYTTTNVISLSFGANYTAVMSSSEVAGVVPVANWNALSNASGLVSALRDNSGAATSVGVQWTCANLWSLGITDAAGDSRVMKGYLDTAASGANAIVNITGIPASYASAGYDVIVYCDGDNGKEARVGQYTLDATSIYCFDAPFVTFAGTFTQATGTSDQGTNTSAGNYVRFTGLTNSSFTVMGIPGSSTDVNARAPINAIQIVATISVPPTITLSPTNVCPYSAHNQAIAPDGMAGYMWSVTNAAIASGTRNNQTLLYDLGNTTGFVGVTLFVTNLVGEVSSNFVQVPISPIPGASIQVAGPVCAGSVGNTATVATSTNAATFAWSISNGTITSATNIQNITFTAGSSGTVGLSVLVTSSAGCDSGDYTEATITARPTATITTPASALGNSTNTATGPAGASSY